MLFKDLAIIDPIQKALKEAGYENPTLIQEKSIPTTLMGKDLLGCAQTGTGKTAAFAIPVLQNVFNKEREANGAKKTIKALILAPTRELAIQIGESFDMYSKYTGITNTVIFGGVSQGRQVRALRAGIDILIATPGRLIDLVNQKFINLSNVEYFVLDEADRMLDMGMVHDVKRIISKLPKVRQNMLFSATMPKEVTKLVDSILKDPVKVEVAPVSSTVDSITQGVYFVGKKHKKNLLIDILKDETITSLLVFSRTKHEANVIARELEKVGIEASAIHGNKSQNARQLALSSFKEGKIRVLVATDIASRGIDIDELSHVINYDLPEVPESYVHRIGRTGRAGNTGIALSFCDAAERGYLKDIEKVIKKSIPVIEGHDYPAGSCPTTDDSDKQTKGKRTFNSGRNSNSRSNFNNRNSNNRKKSTNSNDFNSNNEFDKKTQENKISKRQSNNSSTNSNNDGNKKSTQGKSNKGNWWANKRKSSSRKSS